VLNNPLKSNDSSLGCKLFGKTQTSCFLNLRNPAKVISGFALPTEGHLFYGFTPSVTLTCFLNEKRSVIS